MVAGNKNELADKAACDKVYARMRSTHMYFTTQNSLTFPSAEKYVNRLFTEAPDAKDAVKGKLAIVTGVTVGGAGYYMAEELAVTAEMAVTLMGRNTKKLKDAADAIIKEAAKRKAPEPELFEIKYDLNSLKSAVSAAEEATKIAKESYEGQIHVLVNNAGAVAANYGLTEEGVETNVGRNYLAPHLLTDKLLPVLRAAATDSYKPRVVNVSSLGHCEGHDFDPDRLQAYPKEGGAPEGFIIKDDEKEGDEMKYAGGAMAATEMYCRSKMALVADAVALAKQEKKLAVVSLHPGSIVSNFGNELGIGAMIYYYGFYLFQLSSSQGARAALRAALDPDFNMETSLQGAYLHSDGNPWPPADPTLVNPSTNKPYSMDEYAGKVYKVGDDMCSKLLRGNK